MSTVFIHIGLIFFLINFSIQAQDLNQGLVLYYSLDKGVVDRKVNDDSRNGLDGQVIGSPISVYNGLFLNCDASRLNNCNKSGGDYIQMPTLGPIWQQGLTVSAWVKFGPINRNFERIIEIGNGEGDSQSDPTGKNFLFGRDGTTSDLRVENWLDKDRRHISSLNVKQGVYGNELHHYAATVSPTGVIRIYIDGRKMEENSKDIHPIQNIERTKNFWGKSNWCYLDPDFRGLFDELRLYNRELSETEMAALYQIKPESLKASVIISSNNGLCTNRSLTAEANFTLQKPKYTWFLDGRPLSDTTATIKPITTGKYSVLITETSPCHDLAARSAEQIVNFPSYNHSVTISKCNQALLKAGAGEGNISHWIGPGILPSKGRQDTITVIGSGKVVYTLRIYPSQADTSCYVERQVDVNFPIVPTYMFVPTSTTVCQDSLKLTPPISQDYDQYVWLLPTGKSINQREITASISGNYTLVVTNRQTFCSQSVEVYVRLLSKPVVNLGPDTSICQGERFYLRPNLLGAIYRWQDGSQGNEFLVTSSGQYAVLASLSGCTGSDTITIITREREVFDLGPTKAICSDSTITLTIPQPSSSKADYVWSDNTTSPTLLIKNVGLYWLQSTFNNCVFRDSVLVVDETDCASDWKIFVPGAFTPDSHPMNNVFEIKGNLSGCSITIYNRWGAIIYLNETLENRQFWDGRFKGIDCPPDNYTWQIVCQNKFLSKQINPFIKNGTVLLVR
ncbi:LamG-like jellyroll fold domain-containing protein [Spirosoma endbachense]|nr:LamG-like jellyroll fold domain-containing protein [Spirosoma endbachense]